MTNPLMPAVFFGHGSPMNTLDRNRYTEAWQAFGTAESQRRAPSADAGLGYGGGARDLHHKLEAQSTFNFRIVEVLMMLMLPLLAVSLAVPNGVTAGEYTGTFTVSLI